MLLEGRSGRPVARVVRRPVRPGGYLDLKYKLGCSRPSRVGRINGLVVIFHYVCCVEI